MSILDDFATAELDDLRARGLLREPDDGSARRAAMEGAAAAGVAFIDASSNDYLGLASRDVSRETGVQVGPPGAGASRLIHGTRESHSTLERELASWVRLPVSLLFTSGYAANLGLMSALGSEGSVILSDRLNHASIVDGCRLARARVAVVPHLELGPLEQALREHAAAKARWVVVESCFSMDGDGPDLGALRKICDAHRAGLIVDEAHSLGVFGPDGAGRCVQAGIVPDALMGALGKSVGAAGAFVAGSPALLELLWNLARSFVFSTATSPLLASVALLHVQRARKAEAARAQLLADARELRAELASRMVPHVPGLGGPIVPVLVGSNERALSAAAALAAQGILTQAIRPPTVPTGEARLRVTVTASWPRGSVERVATAVASALESRA